MALNQLLNTVRGFNERNQQAGMYEAQREDAEAARAQTMAQHAMDRQRQADIQRKGWEREDLKEKRSLAMQLAMAQRQEQRLAAQEAERNRREAIKAQVDLLQSEMQNQRMTTQQTEKQTWETEQNRLDRENRLAAARAGRPPPDEFETRMKHLYNMRNGLKAQRDAETRDLEKDGINLQMLPQNMTAYQADKVKRIDEIGAQMTQIQNAINAQFRNKYEFEPFEMGVGGQREPVGGGAGGPTAEDIVQGKRPFTKK